MAVTVNLVLWANNWQFGVINCSLVINGGISEVRVCLFGGRGAAGKIAEGDFPRGFAPPEEAYSNLIYTAINHQTAVYHAKSANLLAQRNRLICYLPKKCAVDCTINDM